MWKQWGNCEVIYTYTIPEGKKLPYNFYLFFGHQYIGGCGYYVLRVALEWPSQVVSGLCPARR